MNLKKIGVFALTAVLSLGLLAGCNNDDKANESGKTNSTADSGVSADTNTVDLGGAKITMSGSTSMEKLCSALTEAFNADNNAAASAQYTGSGAGLEAVAAGTVDIGNSSRALKEEEKAKGLVENVVAIDGIAVILDKANTVTDLTKDQLIQIYKGEVKNWKDLGGNDQPIVVIGRESGSGTRGAFEELLEVEEACKYAQEIDSTGGVMAKVASTPGAIGYVSLDIIDDTVNTAKLEGVEATEENIKSGDYFLSRPFVMATKGEISKQSDAVKALFEYIMSDKGQEIVKKVGLISSK